MQWNERIGQNCHFISLRNAVFFHVKCKQLMTAKMHKIFIAEIVHVVLLLYQESPAIADKPARRESLPKLLQFDVPTTLSLKILAYLHAFNCYCIRNPRNPEKFTENSN